MPAHQAGREAGQSPAQRRRTTVRHIATDLFTERTVVSPESPSRPFPTEDTTQTCPALVGYGNYDEIAPARNSTAIASRIRGAELRGYEGGHLFLFQDPAALPEYQAFLRAPSRHRGSS